MSTAHRFHRTQRLCLLCLVHGCSIGAPIVDKVPVAVIDIAECHMPAVCGRLDPVVLTQDHSLPLPSTPCVNAKNRAACDDDGGVSDPDHPCFAPRALSELPATMTCETSRMTFDAGAQKQQLASLDWLSSSVTIQADSPLDIELDAPALNRVSIRLEGPIALHAQQSEQIHNVHIVGASNAAGAPSLDFSQVDVQGLIVGDAEQQFPGTVNLHDVGMTRSSITAASVVIESVVMSDVEISTQQLSGIDAKLTNSILHADALSLSAFETTRVELRSCLGATLVKGEMNVTTLDACTRGAPIHLYDCSLTSGTLDGSFVLDGTGVENSALGASEATEFVMFQSMMMQVTLCDSVDQLQIGQGSSIKCSECVQMLDEPGEACTVPTSEFPALSAVNFCEQLDHRLPPNCEPPLTERERPVPDSVGDPIL